MRERRRALGLRRCEAHLKGRMQQVLRTEPVHAQVGRCESSRHRTSPFGQLRASETEACHRRVKHMCVRVVLAMTHQCKQYQYQ